MIVALVIVAIGSAAYFAGFALLVRRTPVDEPQPFDREQEPYLDDLEARRRS